MRPSAPQEAVKQYPEFEGSYLQLQMARAGVERRITSDEAQEEFVDHVRAHLAKTIEYGQPPEPAHFKARVDPVQAKAQERDPELPRCGICRLPNVAVRALGTQMSADPAC